MTAVALYSTYYDDVLLRARQINLQIYQHSHEYIYKLNLSQTFLREMFVIDNEIP